MMKSVPEFRRFLLLKEKNSQLNFTENNTTASIVFVHMERHVSV